MATQVPVDDEYVALVGKAVYVFAYYEWVLICITDLLEPGFREEYNRGKSVMTSGTVRSRFAQAIDKTSTFNKVSEKELRDCCKEFEDQIPARNCLIHAHPCTDSDGSQVLDYQTNPHRGIPDKKWPKAEVIAIIEKFDASAVRACYIHDKFRI